MQNTEVESQPQGNSPGGSRRTATIAGRLADLVKAQLRL